MDRETTYRDVSALVLAGGAGRRFGGDKARFRLEGLPMIAHVFAAARAVVRPVRLSVGAETPPFALSAEHVRDRVPDAGPLGGLHAGLHRAETPWLLVVACDLPHLTPAVLRQLLAARAAPVDAVVARTPDGRLHPHCACYHRRVLPHVEARLARAQLALGGLLDDLREVRPVDVPPEPLHNVNHRRDLRSAPSV